MKFKLCLATLHAVLQALRLMKSFWNLTRWFAHQNLMQAAENQLHGNGCHGASLLDLEHMHIIL